MPADLFALCLPLLRQGVALYAVGGVVRDGILGRDTTDYDLCGPLSPAQLQPYAKTCGIHLSARAEKFGTVALLCKTADGRKIVAEYTQFRRDSYPKSGKHQPTSVEFVGTPDEDALRRDFTCNALYYDLQNNCLLDPCGGIEDISCRLLRATSRGGDAVLMEDGLRILRLVRFAATLQFDIEKQTFLAAKKHVSTLKDIAKERIAAELLSLFSLPLPQTKRAFDLLTQLDAWPQMGFACPPNMDGLSCLGMSGGLSMQKLLPLRCFTAFWQDEKALQRLQLPRADSLLLDRYSDARREKDALSVCQSLNDDEMAMLLLMYQILRLPNPIWQNDLQKNAGRPRRAEELALTGGQIAGLVSDPKNTSKVQGVLLQSCFEGRINNTAEALRDMVKELDKK